MDSAATGHTLGEPMADLHCSLPGRFGLIFATTLFSGGCGGDVGANGDMPAGSQAPAGSGVFPPGVAGTVPALAAAPGATGPASAVPGASGVAGDPAGTATPSAGSASPSAVAMPGQPAATEPAAEEPLPGPRPGLSARLSKIEYENSILDVLGVELTDADLDPIPADAGDGVFKHFADKQTSVEQHAIGYFDVATLVAERVDMDSIMARHTECPSDGEACGAAVIAELGRRLFRRSLDERETGVFQQLFDTAFAETSDVGSSLRWTLEALLQSPQFLFLIEDETSGTVGQARPVEAHELAARLASFLWVSVPDEALLDEADSGALLDPATFDAELARMLADPKAQRFTATFIGDFSRARLASFEGVTDEMRDALNDSITETFQHHFWQAGRSVAELFTTTEFVVNPTVADILGVPSDGSEDQVVDVSGLPERVGLMTHPGAIAGMGDRNIGSFVNRGKYLMERLLCRNPISFPAALLPDVQSFVADTTGFNERERMEARKTRPECWTCHQQFDPLAIGFSRFDGAGHYLGDTDDQGKSLGLDGWVPTTAENDAPHYGDVAEYMQILSTEPMVQTCMTEHFIAFATARQTDDTAKAYAKVVGAEYTDAGSTLSAMVDAVAKTDLFQSIQVVSATEPATGDQL